jgi:hypothetical protein
MAWISAEKRYTYSTFVTYNSRQIVFKDVKVEFIWDIKHREALIVISFDGKYYEPKYNARSFINAARVFLRIVKKIENTPSIEEFLKNLEI